MNILKPQQQSFSGITPQIILSALEEQGLHVTGRVIPLNSMENRVYEIELDLTEEEEKNLKSPYDKSKVVKLYRPNRWTREQILEEHEFYYDLKSNEIPVVVPEMLGSDTTLFSLPQIELNFAVFPKTGGRIDYDLNDDKLQLLGRTLARIHQVGSSKKVKHRLNFDLEIFLQQNALFLKTNNFIPMDIEKNYLQVVDELTKLLSPVMSKFDSIRIHGDCHLGNVLWQNDKPIFVDLDDFVSGPRVQDIWLLTPSRDEYGLRQRAIFLEGYESLSVFNKEELRIIEGLRAVRYVHYAAWIARRYEDPIFKSTFPDFRSWNYWNTQVSDLREQLELLKKELN